MTVADRVVKGVFRGAPVEHTPADINKNIVTKRNPTAVRAKRMGTSTAVILVVEGKKGYPITCFMVRQ